MRSSPDLIAVAYNTIEIHFVREKTRGGTAELGHRKVMSDAFKNGRC
jgi:hypothetical protein